MGLCLVRNIQNHKVRVKVQGRTQEQCAAFRSRGLAGLVPQRQRIRGEIRYPRKGKDDEWNSHFSTLMNECSIRRSSTAQTCCTWSSRELKKIRMSSMYTKTKL